jgi:hypothetical protein
MLPIDVYCSRRFDIAVLLRHARQQSRDFPRKTRFGVSRATVPRTRSDFSAMPRNRLAPDVGNLKKNHRQVCSDR